MLEEVKEDTENWKDHVDHLRSDVEGIKSSLDEFITDFKTGKFSCVGHNVQELPTIGTGTPSCSRSSPAFEVPNFTSLIECKILSHTRELVGYGRKTQPGAVSTVHFHTLRKNEVRVLLDDIKVPEYPVWGGKQAHCENLEDVGKNGIMYWLDDLCPPIGDTDE